MDVDEYRNMINLLSGIPLLNGKYCFYYDETGNVRKFRLTENGVNAEEGIDNDFVLGGVLYKGDDPPCDLDLISQVLNVGVNSLSVLRQVMRLDRDYRREFLCF